MFPQSNNVYPVSTAAIGVHATKEPRIRQKINDLGASLEMLEKSLIELGNKLSDVMKPEEATPAGNDVPIPHELCPMADILQGKVRHVEYLRERVDSIVSRLEV